MSNRALDIINEVKAKRSNKALDVIRQVKAESREKRRKELQAKYDKEAEQYTAMTGDVGKDFLAGVGSGMMSIARGAGNMLGLVDDDTIMEQKMIDRELSDSTVGSVGQFTGEMAALAPLGVVGKGSQLAHTAVKGRGMLPMAARLATSRGASAAVEGGIAGAIASNPNERGQGATLGAGTGLILNRAMAGLSRIGKHGLAKTSQSSKDLTNLVEKKTGKRPFIPLTQASDIHAGPITARTHAIMDAASLLPSARAKMLNQADEFAQDMYETNIRQAFGGRKADAAVDTLRRSGGDMQMALEAGKNAGRAGFSPTQQILDTAARGSVRGQYTPRKLLRAAERSQAGDIAYSPLRDTALKMEDVMSRPVGTSNVHSRQIFHSLGNMIGMIADQVPGFGPFLASKGFQNFLMGNTGAQRALQAAMATGSGKAVREVLSQIRRTMAAQPAISDESGDLPGYSTRAIETLRGFQQ